MNSIPPAFRRMKTFDRIPIEIFKVIQQYLAKSHYLQLLSTSKTIFEHCKYETVYYNIAVNHRNIFKLSIFLRKNFVRNRNQQISLSLTAPTEEVFQTCSGFLAGIHKLNLRYHNPLSNSLNMSLFDNIYDLNLECIEGVEYLSGLSGIKILEVSNSESIIAIDFIPGLKRLVLQILENLLEISGYENIPELQIVDCFRLNLQGFGNHDKAFLSWSDNSELEEPFNISMFKNVKSFRLEFVEDTLILSSLPVFENLVYLVLRGNSDEGPFFPFDPSYFPNLQFLHLSFAKISSKVPFPSKLQLGDFYQCSFDDLSVLSHGKELRFRSCQGGCFNNVNALSNAYKLYFRDIQELEDVSSLSGVYDLRVISCMKVRDISALSRVPHLSLDCCKIPSLEGLGQGNSNITFAYPERNIDLSPLRSIYKVTLKDCDDLVNGRDLANVQHLTIFDCYNFVDTSGLGKVKILRLASCNGNRKLVGLENVPHIHLQHCHALEDIDCLGKQHSLIIFNCKRLTKLMEAERYKKLIDGIPLVKIDVEAFSWSYRVG